MLSNYVCLKNNSFDLDDKCFAVDKQLAKTIEILNKKGYYTEICSKASIFHAFLVSNIFHDLMEEKLIIVDKQTKEKLINLINHFDYESTIILFKEKYPFEYLPKGYKLFDKNLDYNLSILKTDKAIKFKSLIELEKELNKSLKLLESWAEKLPNIINL